jgi:Outer membrane receptor proteins, mostly Fe transport
MLRALIPALLLVINAGYVYAQPACNLVLSGTVVEKHNGEPLYPVIIHIDELNKEYDADENGKFSIDSLCAGEYTVHLHTSGYEHYQEVIKVGANMQLRFRLSHLTHELGEVRVSAEKEPTVMQSKAGLSKAEIAEGSGKNLSQLLQNVNGVSLLSNGGTIAKPVIHGLHSNRIVMLNNGVRQEDQQWGGEHAPNIDPFLANKITVIKGAAGVRYGTDAIAGVVLVEPAPLPTKPGWNGEANAAAFSNNRMGVASAMLEHNFEQIPALSFRVQGTYKQAGNYRIPGYWVANTGVNELNYSAALGWRKLHYGVEVFYSHFDTELGVYSGSHTGNEKDMLAAIASDTPMVSAGFTYGIERPKQHVSHDMVKTRLYGDTRIGMFTATHAYQHNYRQEYDLVRKENGKAQLNLTLNTQTLNINLDHKPIGAIKGQIGIDGIMQINRFENGDRVFIPSYNSQGAAAYLIERYAVKKWKFEAGLRYDYRDYEMFNAEGPSQQLVRYAFDYSSVSGTLGINRKLKEGWDVSATLANAWRAPQANELFSAGLHHGAARIELGDKSLQPERSYNLNLESNYSRKKLSADVSLYTQYINDFIYLEPGADELTIRGYFKTFNYRQTDAWLTGADATVRYQFDNHWQGNVKASVLRARNTVKNDWLILMPADRASAGMRYTSNISKTLQDCYIGIDGRYTFEQTRIPADFDSLDNMRPPAGYLLLDAEAGTKLMFNKQAVHLSISVANMLNTAYRDYLDAFRYFLNQPGTNVALRVRVPFSF